MKKLLFSIIAMVILIACKNTTKNKETTIDSPIIGKWNVIRADLGGDLEFMKSSLELDSARFEEMKKATKVFEKVGFTFKKNGKLFVKNPPELGGEGPDVNFSINNNNTTINFGGKDYKLELHTNDSITITEIKMQGDIQFLMHCKRVK